MQITMELYLEKIQFFLQIMIVHTKVQYHLIIKELKLKQLLILEKNQIQKLSKKQWILELRFIGLTQL